MDVDWHARIRERAHEIWEQEGRPEGRARDHWLRATAQIAGSESDKPRASIKESLSLIRDVLLILAILPFFTGWLYAYYFLDHFGIASYMSDIPIYAFYFYAINILVYAISSGWPVLIVMIIVTMILVALFLHVPKARYAAVSFLRQRSAVSFLICVALGFVFLLPVTWYAALEDAAAVQRSNSNIQFQFKDNSNLVGANHLITDRGERCFDNNDVHILTICVGNIHKQLVLLRETSDYFIVLHKPVAPGNIQNKPNEVIYRIPTSEIVLAASRMANRRMANESDR